ncbi:MAG: hypothetical protein K6E75_03440 [Lachnospiraceae bacterium]|nr:hypothetical protein [Lachnospiraceae bacterium]
MITDVGRLKMENGKVINQDKKFMVVQSGSTAAVTLDYDVLKTQLKIELTEQVNGFVRIGYLLKQARDTDILAGSEYENVMDFAAKEFHLTKDVVSRYINICEKYSVGGNSDRLLEEYTEYGYAKLSEMLTLPDEIAEEITPQTTRAEIQEIKREYREEQNVTPLETMIEEPVKLPEEIREEASSLGIDSFDTLMGKTLYLLCKDDIALFDDLLDVARRTEGLLDDVKPGRMTFEAFAPEGQSTRTVRVPQTGKIMVSAKEDKITLTNMRSLEKETWQPHKVLEIFNQIMAAAGGIGRKEEDIYAELYGNEEVAPVQQPAPEQEEIQTGKKEDTDAAKGQRDDSQRAAEEEHTEAVPENGVLRSENAASGGFINDPEEPETVKIDPAETEIVEKEIQIPKNEPVKTPESRISTPYDDMSPEELARTTRDLIRAWTLKFDTEPDDRRQPGADALIKYMESLVYHIREHKWLVAADCAKEIARAAEYINKMEDQIYEERKGD